MSAVKLRIDSRLQGVRVLLQSDADDGHRTREIPTLDQFTSGMNGTSDGNANAAQADPLVRSRTPDPPTLQEPFTHNHYNNGTSPTGPTTNGDRDHADPSLSPSAAATRAVAGKSGRVIEKLMAENDRLRRELKVETTMRAEERKAKEAIQQSRDSLQSTNDNLIHQNNVDRASLARKDRVISELRTERDYERQLRITAESDLNVQVKNYDSTVQDLKSALSHETAERKRHMNQYEVLQQSWKHLDDGYRARVEKLREQLETLQVERAHDHDVLKRLEVTVEQQRQELDKLRAAKNRITEKCEETIVEAESSTKAIRKMAEKHDMEMSKSIEEAKTTVGQMRHIIGVKKNLRPDTKS